MCGIAGIYNFGERNVADRDLQAMARSLVHRGPDDEGFFSDGRVGLAFRRLAIIDLSAAGHQPMTNEDGTLQLIFNGEIYNYRELTKSLQRLGHTFASKTDAEVLLHGYEQYGEKLVHKLNGMFAFAIYDTKTGALFCARDRLGIKPLYYLQQGERFFFGSEIKAILAVQGVRAELDEAMLGEYFVFQNILSDQTLFRNIRILPPGHTMTVQKDGTVALREFWNPAFTPTSKLSFSDAVEKLQTIFERVVQRQLVADVPVGSQLSGGMDSASIVAVAARHIPHLRTFTAGFDLALASGFELNFDERRDAERIAHEVKSEHYEMVIQAGDMERILPKLIWHLEDLRLGNSYPNYYIAQLAGKFVKVALAGAGGDELFAGYPWRYEVVRGKTNGSDFDKAFYKYWMRLLKDSDRERCFQGDVWERMQQHDPHASFRSVLDRVEGEDPLTKALYFELKTFLHGLLVIEDKVSSAHGLETRVPFLDNELIDFALSLPGHFKVRNGDGKRVLRKALAQYLPTSIIRKKKQGFAAPERTWFRKESLAYVRATLLSKESLIRAYIRPEYMEKILRSHTAGRSNHRLLIWSFLSFEWWLRVFLNGQQQQSK